MPRRAELPRHRFDLALVKTTAYGIEVNFHINLLITLPPTYQRFILNFLFLLHFLLRLPHTDSTFGE